MADTLLFDVMGTLLDTAALDPLFDRVIGRPGAREAWYQQATGLTMAGTLSGRFQPFGVLADAAFQMTAAKDGVLPTEADRRELTETLETLPPFPDVAAGLARLMAKGFKLAALTNGTHKAVVRQIEHAKLHGFFGHDLFSVDSVKKYKPAPETYRYAADYLGVKPAGVTLVAAHAWDTAGAQAAGMKAAFLARPRQVPDPAGPVPQYTAADLNVLASQLGA